MQAETIGLVASILTLVLLWMRLPVALVVGGIGIAGSVLLHLAGAKSGGPWSFVGNLASELGDLSMTHDLALIPLVIVLGNLAFYAGITTRLYDAAAVFLRRMPGGMAMAAVLGCGGFSAISGSSVACASTMGRICVPEMLRLGYDPKLATASVAVGGTLGALVPPSILFVIYGHFTQTEVAQLFLAGLLPGLLSLLGMLLVVGWWISDDFAAAPGGDAPAASRTEAAMAVWPALLLFVIIVGGLFSGFLGPFAALLLAVLLVLTIGFLNGRLTLDVLWGGLRESLMQSVAILVIVIVATLYFDFLRDSRAADLVLIWAERNGMTYFAMLCVVVAVFLVLGMFIDSLGILVLTLPFFMPLAQGFDMNLVWFGVIMVKLLEIGLITPPVGLNVFVIANVTRGVSVEQVFSGVARFLMVEFLVLLLLLLFPVIALLLPGAM